MDPTLTGIRTAGIVSSFVTAILFGLYLASFAHCVRWLLFEDEGWRVRKKINWTLVTATLLVFSLSTASFSTTAAVGIPHNPITLDGGDLPAYFWAVTILINSNAIYFSILLIIDSVLIHRCWIVYSKNWFIICFPLALWCSCLAWAIILFCCTISPWLTITDINEVICGAAPVLRLTFYVCNIVVSIYTTAALVFKIWSAAKNNVGTTHLYRTSEILIESGILYTFSSGFFLACLIVSYIINSPGQTFDSFLLSVLLVDISMPIGTFMPGIAFNFITIRVGEQRGRVQDTWVDSRDASNALMPSTLLDHADTLTQQEAESTDLGQLEGRGRIEEVIEINGKEFGQIMEVDRTLTGAAIVRTCQELSEQQAEIDQGA